MPAVAMTDHGNLFGAIEFYQEAKKAGIKPIIGCEVYMAPGEALGEAGGLGAGCGLSLHPAGAGRGRATGTWSSSSPSRTSTACITSRGSTRKCWRRYSAGLIGMSGCLKGEINQGILSDQPQKAREALDSFVQILGTREFLPRTARPRHRGAAAVQRRRCRRWRKEFGVGLVAANDVHFLERVASRGARCDDLHRHRLECRRRAAHAVRARALLQEPRRRCAPCLQRHPEAVENTLRIAERCDLKLEFGKPKYPNYTPPEG